MFLKKSIICITLISLVNVYSMKRDQRAKMFNRVLQGCKKLHELMLYEIPIDNSIQETIVKMINFGEQNIGDPAISEKKQLSLIRCMQAIQFQTMIPHQLKQSPHLETI